MFILFAPFTLWFWLLILVCIGLVIYALEESDNNGITWATVTMAATFLLLFFFGGRQVISGCFHFIVQNPGTTLLIVAGYIVFGVVWSFFKWFIYIRKRKDKLTEKYRNAISEYRNAKRDTDYYMRSMVSDIKNQLSVANNKSRIMSWMTYWPISLLWNLINDPIKKTFAFIYGRVQGAYSRMSDRMEKKIHNELNIEVKPKDEE